MRKYRLKNLIIPLLIGIGLYLINYSFLRFIFYHFPITLELTFGNGAWWLSVPWHIQVLYVGIIAPVFEELIFRNLVFKWFLKKDYFISGLVFSSVLFGFWHMVSGWGILKALNMMLVGAVFGLVYKKYYLKGSLVCHISNNLLSLVFLLVVSF